MWKMFLPALIMAISCASAAEAPAQPAGEAPPKSTAAPTTYPVTGASADIPAFPGAEGWGAYTRGGRGGKVYVVTTLADYEDDAEPIPGSLRNGLQIPGPKTIVFAVGGNIELKRRLWVRTPYVTIAGQTAPGDGICLKGESLSISNHNNDVVIRYIRARLGDLAPGAGDAIGARTCRNIILDHCSASWSIDECVSLYRNENTTVQWCLISESLYRSKHPKGRHGYGGIWGGEKATFHHNLLAHNSSRNPRFTAGLIDYRNNVIYNWGYKSAYGGENGRINMIANYYKPGPATTEHSHAMITEAGPTTRYYIADNFVLGHPDVTADNWSGVRLRGAALADVRAKQPFPAPPLTPQTAEQAYEAVLAQVGCSRPRRDSLDKRIIEEVRTGTATFGGQWEADRGGLGIIDTQTTVGGWPELKGGPAPADGDMDGMPDEWETARGLNPADAADAAGDRDGDGYTNIEEYVNSLAQPPIGL